MSSTTELIIAIAQALVPVSGIVAAWFAWRGKKITERAEKQTTEINRAVNHVGEGEPRLIELAARANAAAEANRDDISTVVDLIGETNTTLNGVRNCIDHLRETQVMHGEHLDQHIAAFDAHLAEMAAKEKQGEQQ